MTQRFDLHCHTLFCDGKNTPEEMVLAAVSRGLSCLGFSAHSYTFFDESYCLARSRQDEYRREIDALRVKYAHDIDVLCGIEQDLFSREPVSGWDYVIGSAHYILAGGTYVPVDEAPEILESAADRYFSGSLCALAEAYFETAARIPEETGADIIGHFDLIAKFSEQLPLLDEDDGRYASAAEKCLRSLAASGLPLEINTGAISRGLRSVPYPSPRYWELIAKLDIPVCLSSDSHSAGTLAFGFERWQAEAECAGLHLLTEPPVKKPLTPVHIS